MKAASQHQHPKQAEIILAAKMKNNRKLHDIAMIFGIPGELRKQIQDLLKLRGKQYETRTDGI